jgi:polyphosphate kinase 2 (PPK2 family)
MAGPEGLQAFQRFVKAEQELLSLLKEWVARDQQMLVEFQGVDASGG